jgi:hypothetical protein
MRSKRHRFEGGSGDWQDRVDDPGTCEGRGDFPDGIEQIAGAAVMAAQSILELVVEPLIDLIAGLSSRAQGSATGRPHDAPGTHERQSEV